jgi:hypothetical protein
VSSINRRRKEERNSDHHQVWLDDGSVADDGATEDDEGTDVIDGGAGGLDIDAALLGVGLSTTIAFGFEGG